ncbi:MAG: pantoate--beta-alanine ligase, partial [Alphaproteobacteria bacterium]|nr:pantoate--beta-alanine ligase [Alphaproteobacteria bacterium]
MRSVAELRATVAAWRRSGDTVGFVPTMGALHEGHITLVRKAQQACTRAVVSIFVNPKQFGPREDFTSYPRQEMADAMALTRAGCDLLYAPAVREMYPEGFRSTVSVAGLSDGLCGAHRPGHFEGVATVVTKLLLQVGADAAYFGEKD